MRLAALLYAIPGSDQDDRIAAGNIRVGYVS